MGVLETVLKFKQAEEAKANADFSAIATGLQAFGKARQAKQVLQFERLKLNASMAQSGFSFDPDEGKFTPDQNLIDKLGLGGLSSGKIKAGIQKKALLEGVGSLTPTQRRIGGLEEDVEKQLKTRLLQRVVGQLDASEQPQTDLIGRTGIQTGQPTGLPPGTSLNIGGITLPLVPKKSASQEKREVEAKQLSDELQGLFDSFATARAEGQEFAGDLFGARGLTGRATGFVAGKVGRAGFLPAIDVFNAKRKAFATVVAKAAGEVRPTDVDIERFKETLMSTGRSDEENELIMKDLLRKVQSGDRAGLRKLWEDATGRKIGSEKLGSEKSALNGSTLKIQSVTKIGD